MRRILLICLSALAALYGGSRIMHSYPTDLFRLSSETKEAPVEPPRGLPGDPIKGGDAVSVIVPYVLESTQNTFNIGQFKDLALPSNHKAVLGFGSPGFLEWREKEPLDIFRKGFTHYSNNNVFTERQAPSQTQHWFLGFTDLIKNVAAELVSKYPDAAYVASGRWSAISEKTAMEIGMKCWEKRSSGYNYETKSYSRSSEYAYYLLDEEQFSGDVNPFLGKVLRGWRRGNNTCIVNLYGKTFNYFYLKDLPAYPHKYPDSEILGFRDKQAFAFNDHSFRLSRATIDVSGGYFRVPVIRSSIYEQKGGKYTLDSKGRRILRRDNFTERIFGRDFNLLNQPSAQLLKNSVTPSKSDWKTDVEWMLQELYLYQDYLTVASLNYAHSEFDDFDISRWRAYDKKKTITFRPRTEPWTYGGNDYRIRETGEYAILYQVLFAFFNGIDYVESWDDGWGGEPLKLPGTGAHEIKKSGEQLYPTPGYGWDNPPNYWNPTEKQHNDQAAGDDNYSRYVVYTAAVQTFAKVCKDNQYKFDNSLRYVRFNPPVNTFRNKEILASGIYQHDKLSLAMMYPYLDENDKTNVELKIGNKTINFTLKSRKPAVFTWTVPKNVDPKNITMRYVNIDGNERKIRGWVDGDRRSTYLP